MKSIAKGATWRELPIAGLIPESGTAEEYQSGDWRIQRPVWDEKKCIHCLFCWIYCPDSSIKVKEGKFAGFDLNHCKGCGICAKECPPKARAISMHPESEFR